jgi:hypothetical protein
MLLIPAGLIGGFATFMMFVTAGLLWAFLISGGDPHATFDPEFGTAPVFAGGFLATYVGLRNWIYRRLDRRRRTSGMTDAVGDKSRKIER